MAEDREGLTSLKSSLEAQILHKKQSLIYLLETVIDNLTATRSELEASMENPSSRGGLGTYGELQIVSRVESNIGMICGLVRIYNELYTSTVDPDE